MWGPIDDPEFLRREYQAKIQEVFRWLKRCAFLCGYAAGRNGRQHIDLELLRPRVHWITAYGVVDVQFFLSPRSDEPYPGDDISQLFRVCHKEWETRLPLAYTRQLVAAVESMVKEFFPQAVLENSLTDCVVCRDPLVMCTLIGDKWLCERCVDRFSLVDLPPPSPYALPQQKSERAKMTKALRFSILQRDNFVCCFCGRGPLKGDAVKLEVDHKAPIAHGGLTVPENLHTTCHDCNSGKSDTLVEQFTLPLE